MILKICTYSIEAFEISHVLKKIEIIVLFHSTKALTLRIQNPKYNTIMKKSFNDPYQNKDMSNIVKMRCMPILMEWKKKKKNIKKGK